MIILFFFLLFIFPSSALATVLSDAILACPTGTFCQIPNASMPGWSSGQILESGSSSDYITQFSNRAVWNPISNKFQFVGSAHGGTNSYDLAIFDDATATWSMGVDPQPPFSGNPQHTYDQNAMSPIGTHYFRRYDSFVISSLANGAGSWGAVSPNIPSGSKQCCGALEWFQDMGTGVLFWIDGDWGGWSWNPSNGQWTHHFRTNGNDGSGLPQLLHTGASTGNWSVYSKAPGQPGVLVFGGGSFAYKIDGAGVMTTLATPPFAIRTGSGSTCCSVAPDPTSGRVVVIDQNRAVWELNPAGSGTWTNTGRVSPIQFIQGLGNGTGEGLINAPTPYGAIMYVKYTGGTGGTVWVYKHGSVAPDTTPPTTPTNLTLSAISPTQVNLSWTASTDNVAVSQYLIERCTGAACTNTAQIATTTSPGYSNTGLTAATTYGYKIRAQDSATNLSPFTAIVYVTTPAADITAPTAPLLLTATANQPTQIVLNWTAATDAIGVTGNFVERCAGGGCSNFVQVASIGPVVTYTDTGLVPSTVYLYRIRATDAAANLGSYSNTATVTTLASTSDFVQRCATAGVLRCFDFDTAAQFPTCVGGFNGCWGQNFGYMPPNGTTDYSRIARDTTVAASGVSSLRFTIPSNSGSDVSGAWFTNITSDLSNLIGQGESLYIGWRQRFDTNYRDIDFTGAGGKKQMIIGAGDRSGAGQCNPASPTSFTCPSSCTDIEVVPTAEDITPANGTFSTYNSCVTFAGFQYFDSAQGQVTTQNNIPGCLYPVYAVPPCWQVKADEWMHFKVRISIGTWNTANSTFQMWIGREGQPSVLVHDFRPGNGHPWNAFRCGTADGSSTCGSTLHEYGKVWLLPYMTGKSSAQTHAPAFTWYDDLIISTQDFPDPGAITPPPLLTGGTGVSGKVLWSGKVILKRWEDNDKD